MMFGDQSAKKPILLNHQIALRAGGGQTVRDAALGIGGAGVAVIVVHFSFLKGFTSRVLRP
jgi:hypothetical protein